MKIVILAKHVPDTWGKRAVDLETGMLDRSSGDNVVDEIDERVATAVAALKSEIADAEVVAVTMGGEEAQKSLRKILALGADRAVHVNDPALAGSDAVQTARVLASVVEAEGADLVIGGMNSTDGGTGAVPAMVAEILGRVVIPAADEFKIEGSEVKATVVDGIETLELTAPLPAVITLTEKVAEPKLANFKAIREAKKKEIAVKTLADLGIIAGPEAAYVRSVMVSAAARPPREAGPKVSGDTAVEQLVDFLAARHVI